MAKEWFFSHPKFVGNNNLFQFFLFWAILALNSPLGCPAGPGGGVFPLILTFLHSLSRFPRKNWGSKILPPEMWVCLWDRLLSWFFSKYIFKALNEVQKVYKIVSSNVLVDVWRICEEIHLRPVDVDEAKNISQRITSS